MTISANQLDAFAAVARTGSFSSAAKALHITQSALSQRVINLETDLETSLLIRDASGVRLTPAGEELLRYWQVKNSLEGEVLNSISGSKSKLGGTIRIATFSSLARSIVMPAISQLMNDSDGLTIELFAKEMRELQSMLASNEVDFIVTSTVTNRQDIESHLLGYEENVLIECKRSTGSSKLFLDHDPADETTYMFFKKQKAANKPVLRRAYVDEVYAIIDGVTLGWGQAVVPKHLIADNSQVRILKNYRSLFSPVYLQFYRRPYYTRLHEAVVAALLQKVRLKLKQKPNSEVISDT